MKHFLKSYKFWVGALLLLADGLFFTRTNPAQVASSLLILAVGLVVGTMYVILRAILALLNLYNPWFGRQKRVVVALTAASAVVLALQSIGQLSWRDCFVLIGVALLTFFYVKMAHTRPQA